MGLVSTAGGHDLVAPNKSGPFAKKKKKTSCTFFHGQKRKGSFRTRLGNMSGEVMVVVAAVSLAALVGGGGCERSCKVNPGEALREEEEERSRRRFPALLLGRSEHEAPFFPSQEFAEFAHQFPFLFCTILLACGKSEFAIFTPALRLRRNARSSSSSTTASCSKEAASSFPVLRNGGKPQVASQSWKRKRGRGFRPLSYGGTRKKGLPPPPKGENGI